MYSMKTIIRVLITESDNTSTQENHELVTSSGNDKFQDDESLYLYLLNSSLTLVYFEVNLK